MKQKTYSVSIAISPMSAFDIGEKLYSSILDLSKADDEKERCSFLFAYFFFLVKKK